jgi:hypothetical protein
LCCHEAYDRDRPERYAEERAAGDDQHGLTVEPQHLCVGRGFHDQSQQDEIDERRREARDSDILLRGAVKAWQIEMIAAAEQQHENGERAVVSDEVSRPRQGAGAPARGRDDGPRQERQWTRQHDRDGHESEGVPSAGGTAVSP